jgi:hypothetical protein
MSEVSDMMKKGEETLGMERMGRRVKVSSQAGVQSQQVFLLVRSWRGRVMLEKSGMNHQ